MRRTADLGNRKQGEERTFRVRMDSLPKDAQVQKAQLFIRKCLCPVAPCRNARLRERVRPSALSKRRYTNGAAPVRGPQHVKKPVWVAIATRLIPLRAVRSLVLCVATQGFGVPPQTPPRVSPLEPDKGFHPLTPLFRQQRGRACARPRANASGKLGALNPVRLPELPQAPR